MDYLPLLRILGVSYGLDHQAAEQEVSHYFLNSESGLPLNRLANNLAMGHHLLLSGSLPPYRIFISEVFADNNIILNGSYSSHYDG